MDKRGTATGRVKAPAVFTSLASVQESWKNDLLILMYHAIEAPSPQYDLQILYVAPEKFREQVRELKEGEVFFARASQLDQPGRRVWITLDDGYRNAFVEALPILQEFGVPAVSYIVAGQIGGSNVWDHDKNLQKQDLMSRSEILEWIAAGNEIGAHTVNHSNLATLPLAEARREIFDSKKILEDLTGQPIRHFSYPYGEWNRQVRELVQEAGYETATTCKVGYNSAKTDRLGLRRITAIQ